MKKLLFFSMMCLMALGIANCDKDSTGTGTSGGGGGITPAGYVDLGLPSGTLWKDKNEEGGFYTYDQAVSKFGNKLPTKDLVRKKLVTLIGKTRELEMELRLILLNKQTKVNQQFVV